MQRAIVLATMILAGAAVGIPDIAFAEPQRARARARGGGDGGRTASAPRSVRPPVRQRAPARRAPGRIATCARAPRAGTAAIGGWWAHGQCATLGPAAAVGQPARATRDSAGVAAAQRRELAAAGQRPGAAQGSAAPRAGKAADRGRWAHRERTAGGRAPAARAAQVARGGGRRAERTSRDCRSAGRCAGAAGAATGARRGRRRWTRTAGRQRRAAPRRGAAASRARQRRGRRPARTADRFRPHPPSADALDAADAAATGIRSG